MVPFIVMFLLILACLGGIIYLLRKNDGLVEKNRFLKSLVAHYEPVRQFETLNPPEPLPEHPLEKPVKAIAKRVTKSKEGSNVRKKSKGA